MHGMPDTLSPAERSALMAKIKCRDTKPELRVRKRLHALGFRFRLCKRGLPGTPDIVLARYRTVIMVHGCLWHGHRFCAARGRPKSNVEYWRAKIRANRERDRRKERELRRLGWRVITIWECETKREETIDGRIAGLLLTQVITTIAPHIRRALLTVPASIAELTLGNALRTLRWAKRKRAHGAHPGQRGMS